MIAQETLEPRRLLANASGFVDLIDNPYLPLVPGTTYLYRGTDADGTAIRDRVTVTDQTKLITGVTTTVVRDQVFEDGKLSEDTLDFFAQDIGGNVWYFGEESKTIENGVVVSTAGSFEAGVDGAAAGIAMLARPAKGDSYRQEDAPGVAEDHATVAALHKSARTPFAAFGDTLKTEEFTPLEPGTLEDKFYARGIGMVKSQDVKGGSEVLRLAEIQMSGEAFADTIDNPFFPMAPGTTFFYRGTDAKGTSIRDRVNVTHDTMTIAGVTTTVVRDRVFEDGKLTEDTLDFFAQDKAGNVWYFGEDSKSIENGVIVSTAGSWKAGVSGSAKPGLAMLAQPGVGDAYHQEQATGVAEDEARVLSLNKRAAVPFATFGQTLQTREFTRLEPGTLEDKFYAPGIGLVKSQDIKGGSEVLRLVSITFET